MCKQHDLGNMEDENSKQHPRKRKTSPLARLGQREPVSFRSFARHVMIVNSLARDCKRKQTRGRVNYIPSSGSSMVSTSSSSLGSGRSRLSNGSSKRPSSAERFPMSEEMKRTLVALGKLHLLSEKDQLREESEDETIKSRKSKKKSGLALKRFREKTQSRVIQPQRFIRSIQDSLNEKKETETVENNSSLSSGRVTISSQTLYCHDTRGAITEKEVATKSSLAAVTIQPVHERVTNNNLRRRYFRRENAQQGHLLLSKRSKVSTLDHKQFPSFLPKGKSKTACDNNCLLNSSSTLHSMRSKAAYADGKASPTQEYIGSRVAFLDRTQSPLQIPKVHAWTAEFKGCQTNRKGSNSSASSCSAENESKNRSLGFHKPKSAEIGKRWKSVDSLTTEIQNKCSKWFEIRDGVRETRWLRNSVD